MKKKLSLIARHRPARKKYNKYSNSPSIMIEDESCSSAKQYLFALNQHEQNKDNYSRMMLVQSNRHQDLSISQWDSKQSQDWAAPQIMQNSLDMSVGLRKNHFRVKTEHKENDLLRAKFDHQMENSTAILSPLNNTNKMLRKTNRHQNLLQIDIALPQAQKASEQQFFTISNNKQCVSRPQKFLENKKPNRKWKLKHDLREKTPSKLEKNKNLTKKQKIILSANKTLYDLHKAHIDPFVTFQRLNNIQKKKKIDILFIKHKLRHREGVWVEGEKRMKQFFQVDGQSWISQNKLK